MDTNQAFTILNGRNAILASNILSQQQEFAANALAISQLEGVLATQLSSLTVGQVRAFPAVQVIISELDSAKASVTDLQIKLSATQAVIMDLQAQLDAKNAVPAPEEPVIP